MADYYISHVRYGKDKDHITEVRANKLSEGKLTEPVIHTKGSVVQEIRAKQGSFATVYVKDGKETVGANVEVIELDKEFYLRTDSNKLKSDKLDNLPEF